MAAVLGCLVLLADPWPGLAEAASAVVPQAVGQTPRPGAVRQVVRAPKAKGETAVDVKAGAVVVLNDPAFEPPKATFAADDDDLIIQLPGRRTLILGGFFVADERPAWLAVNGRPPAAAQDLARDGFARLTAPAIPRPLVGFPDAATAEPGDRTAYLYVLFPRPDPRHVSFLQALLAADARPRGTGAPPLFCVPVQDGQAARRLVEARRPPAAARDQPGPWQGAARLLAEEGSYDTDRARHLLRGLCAADPGRRPALCEQVLQGPYLLGVTEPLSADAVPDAFVLVDLGAVEPSRFEPWVTALAGQTLASDLPPALRLEALRAAAEPLAAGPDAQRILFAAH
jgi:hypothetical protein